MPLRKRMKSERLKSSISRLPGLPGAFPVDVLDRGDEFLVSAELPGLRKQDLDVRIRKDKVQIVADFGTDAEGGTYLRKERGRGGASRVIQLPERVDEKHVSASYNEGILRVALKKQPRPKHVGTR